MRKYWLLYTLSVCFCVIGILCRDMLRIMDIVFVILGVVLFLFVFIKHCRRKAKRCPNCNALIYGGHIRTISRQKAGVVPCERCGSLVQISYSK